MVRSTGATSRSWTGGKATGSASVGLCGCIESSAVGRGALWAYESASMEGKGLYMLRTPLVALGLCVVAAWMAGCSQSVVPETPQEKTSLVQEAEHTVKWASQVNSEVRYYMARSPAYAVFPQVGKGGLIVGAGYGKGALYEQGHFAGYCDVRQLSVGAQIGGQEYSQIVFFETPLALSRFKNGHAVYHAAVSAVAADASASGGSQYQDGIAVIVLDSQGLMAEAAMGRQEFRYVADAPGGATR